MNELKVHSDPPSVVHQAACLTIIDPVGLESAGVCGQDSGKQGQGAQKGSIWEYGYLACTCPCTCANSLQYRVKPALPQVLLTARIEQQLSDRSH